MYINVIYWRQRPRATRQPAAGYIMFGTCCFVWPELLWFIVWKHWWVNKAVGLGQRVFDLQSIVESVVLCDCRSRVFRPAHSRVWERDGRWSLRHGRGAKRRWELHQANFDLAALKTILELRKAIIRVENIWRIFHLMLIVSNNVCKNANLPCY